MLLGLFYYCQKILESDNSELVDAYHLLNKKNYCKSLSFAMVKQFGTSRLGCYG